MEVKKDLDSNEISDEVRRITRYDGSEAFIRVFLNGGQIFEFKDPNGRIMSVDTFEYLDLDEDDTGEILISAYTDANSRPYSDVLCLKQTEGQWKRLDWSARAGIYDGRDCAIALQGIEGPYGHGLGQLEIYFAYNEDGKIEILKVEYLTE